MGKAPEYVIVDLETTGLDTAKDEIIELAAVKVRRGLVVDEFSSLIKPNQGVGPEIEALTGISNAMLEGQPAIGEVLPAFADFVGRAELLAHNAAFDSGFLHKYWPDPRIWLDTLVLAQVVWPCASSYALANLTAMLDIDNTSAHRALSDALATAELFIRIEKELEALPQPAREDILALAEGDDTPTGELLRRKCRPATAPPATQEPEAKSERPPRRTADETYQVDIDGLADYLGQDSRFRDRLDAFEERPQQLRLAQAVAWSLNQRGCLLAEAGTGVGKSLAYLLPAALFACGGGAQVAVSTYTRNLQEQLLNKDIPMLNRLLDRQVKAAVVKGRSNYLCRRLYRYYRSNPPDNLRYFLMRVAVWQAQSRGGDSAELTLNAAEKWKWQRVSAAKENCAPFCSFARRNSCLVQRARAAAAAADIVILNHSLLIANAAVEKGFLPPLPHLIVDEAQHLEHAAEDQLSSSVDMFELLNLLSRLKRRERGRVTGAMAAIAKYLEGLSDAGDAAAAHSCLDRLDPLLDQVVAGAERFFDLLAALFGAEKQREAFFPAKIRVTGGHREQADWELLLQCGHGLAADVKKLAEQCFKLMDIVNGSCGRDDGEGRPPGADELQAAGAAAREAAATLEACLEEDDNYVVWVEFADALKRPSLNMAPVLINQLLHDCLYQNTETMVFTSATLAAGRDFSFFKQRLGLDLLPEKPRELVLNSPFFYRDQALFAIVNDLPDWSSCGEIAAAEAVGQCLIKLLTASAGRAIVLFTSHHQLKTVYQQIRQPLKEQGVTVLAHGVSGDPGALLRRLRKEPRCCILGANSFWEGVDVAGDALSLIVVVRLPFWPPNTPLAASRSERIEAEGGSSFYAYSLPQALIRFKQGFGRLIRSDRDSGVFCVLDRRILEKSYGRSFIACLPEMRRIAGGSDEVAELLRRHLG